MITWKGGVSWANLLFSKFMGIAYCDPEAVITKRSNFCNHEALCLIAVKGRQGIMPRKQFLEGTIRINDLSEITGLRIVQVATGTGRAFQVIALPGEEIVYWSFLRGKVNRFAIEQAEELDVPVYFGSTLFGKSLSYEYSYAPHEYIIGAAFCITVASFLHIDLDSSNVPVALLAGFGVFQFLQAYRSRVVLKNL